MRWTTEQRNTIETRGKNILVSAAAGSGKTAVLVERILRLILEEQVSIDNILVVTFTNAAAAEMKEKIVKAIKKRIKDEPETRERLTKELEKVPNSSISTFHGFSLNLIKKYFYILGVNPNLKILDETVSSLMKKEVIDEIFDEIKEDDASRVDFVKKYGNRKTDEALKESLLGMYNNIRSIPDYGTWLDNIIPDDFDDDSCKVVSNIKESIAKLIEENVSSIVEGVLEVKNILKDIGFDRHALNIDEKMVPVLDNLQEAIEKEDFDLAEGVISGLKFPVIRANSEEKSVWPSYKELVDNSKKYVKDKIAFLKENVFYQSLDSHIEDLKETRLSMVELKNMILELDQRYGLAKASKDGLDFSDIEHFAIEILKDENVASECRDKYEYIFVDEYQDSNYIQETIIGSIKRENNVFMVGDVKQSIYGFRMAEPDIFRDKYNGFKTGNDDNSIVIDLSCNFRSKKNIIDTVNCIFEGIMNDYNENHKLNLGASYDEKYQLKNQFVIIEKTPKDEISIPVANEGGVGNIDALLDELKSKEIEAYEVVNQINANLGDTYFDHKKGVEATFNYRDFVILFRNLKSNASVFYNTLIDNGIPAYVDSSDGYFDSIEVITLIDILRVIDNSKNDIALLSALRSYVFGFSIDQLIEIRLAKPRGNYEESFRSYGVNGTNIQLKEKINKTIGLLDKWKEDARYTPIDEFVWNLLEETGYYIAVSAMPAGEQRKKNILALLDKAKLYRDSGESGIYGFLEYLDEVKKNVKVGKSVVTLEDDNVVQITTIHKSKGLEYPIVILPYLNSKGNTNKITKIGDFHKDYGFSLSLVDSGSKFIKRTILQVMINQNKKMKEIEEEIRVLYVALTRAKDKLIMIGTGTAEEKIIKTDVSETYFNLILNNLDLETTTVTVKTQRQVLEDIVFRANRQSALQIVDFIDIENFDDNIFNEVRHQLEYEYPYKDQLSIKSKFSVSELNNGKVPKISLNKLEDHLTDSKRISFVRRGQVYHLLMERLDFAKAKEEGEPYITSVIDEIIQKGIITPNEGEIINLPIITNFFETNVGSRAARAKTYKEQPFTMRHDLNGSKVMVQGVIDCFFEEDGEIVLIDYKTNRAPVDIVSKYHVQMELYKEAIEKSLGKKVKEAYIYLFEKGEFVEF